MRFRNTYGAVVKSARMLAAAGLLCGGWIAGAAAQGTFDAAAAEAAMKKDDCFQCHAASRKRDGPTFKETVAKYKGKADAEATILKFLTTNPKVKVDGKEQDHDNLKTKNENDVRNVIRYILSF